MIRNATADRARRLPVPQFPAPDPLRSVSRKTPTTKSSTERRVRISFAPHGRPVERLASAAVVSATQLAESLDTCDGRLK